MAVASTATLTEGTAPATPSASDHRLYVDSADAHLKRKDSAGAVKDYDAGGTGTVTSVSVTTANGVSGVVANPTTTPAITLTLGAITPSSVAASGAVTGSNLSGTNTGDQTITLTGDVTGSGTGSFATTLASVGTAGTYVKVTTDAKGRVTSGSVAPQAVADGGTNSVAALSNNRVMQSSGGAIVEAAAITANKALASNASGIPVASTTSDTELGFVAGVTSAIQTQLNSKQATGNYITDLTGDVTATGPGSAAATLANTGTAGTYVKVTTDAKGRVTSGSASPQAIADGGTGQATANAGFAALSPMTTDQDLITRSGGVPVRLAVGANNQTLQVLAGVITWAAPASPYNVSTISGNTTGVSGVTYLCDTSGAAFNLTLPAPTANAFVVIKDKTGSFNTNNLTVVRAAAEKIEGLAASKILQTNWGSWSLFSDGTDWFMGPF